MPETRPVDVIEIENHSTAAGLRRGLVIWSSVAPRLTASGPIPYPADDANAPLEAGVVISIETTLPHKRRGFIKLEDTIAVTADGYQAFGDSARGWNRIPE